MKGGAAHRTWTGQCGAESGYWKEGPSLSYKFRKLTFGEAQGMCLTLRSYWHSYAVAGEVTAALSMVSRTGCRYLYECMGSDEFVFHRSGIDMSLESTHIYKWWYFCRSLCSPTNSTSSTAPGVKRVSRVKATCSLQRRWRAVERPGSVRIPDV